MGFIILRENGFTTFMSFFGVISGMLAIPCWSELFRGDDMFLGPSIVLTVICIVFYGIVFIACRKAVKKRTEEEARYREDHPR